MLTRAELYELLGYTGYEERDRAYFSEVKQIDGTAAKLFETRRAQRTRSGKEKKKKSSKRG